MKLLKFKLLRIFLKKSFLHKLTAFSLHSKAQENNFNKLIKYSVLLFDHHIKIHYDLYKTIIIKTVTQILEDKNNNDNI